MLTLAKSWLKGTSTARVSSGECLRLHPCASNAATDTTPQLSTCVRSGLPSDPRAMCFILIVEVPVLVGLANAAPHFGRRYVP